ncbi:NeuD/PglB/VioB family sugar acetyltransferase [Clostridium sartagoforme]|uniref:NeuD/PglB/VioB family sugar acetyltransferase n=1 Tax=Clostridium sartagoforme TaxID=84031 RepID=UPI0031CFE31B
MIDVIIFGCGDLAKQVYHYLNASKKFNVICFTVDKKYINSKYLEGKDIIPFEDIESKFPAKRYKFITAIGYKNMRIRNKIYNDIKSKGYDFINYIHESVIINNPINIGSNNLILSNVVIEPNVRIGSNNIIYSNTVIGHDSTLGDNNIISIGNNIAGFTKIKTGCFIGIGSTIINNLTIEDESLIGAGSLIIKSTEKLGLYTGVPAKKLREIDSNVGIEIT